MAASYPLQINFTGICAFAFEPDGSSCDVLFVNTSKPDSAFKDLKKALRPNVHKPFLACRHEDLEFPGTDWEPSEVRPDPSGRSLAIFDISGQNLELDLGSVNDPLSLRMGSSGTEFSKVTDLFALAPTGSAFSESCFASLPNPKLPVVARLKLKHGELFTSRLGQESGRRVNVEYLPVGTNPVTALAISPKEIGDTVTLSVPKIYDQVIIRGSDKKIVLATDTGKLLSLGIANIDKSCDTSIRKQILDYLWYYTLLDLGEKTPMPNFVIPWKFFKVLEPLTPSSCVCPPTHGVKGAKVKVEKIDIEMKTEDLISPEECALSHRLPEKSPQKGSLDLDLVKFRAFVVNGKEVLGKLFLDADNGNTDEQGKFVDCVEFVLPDDTPKTAVLWAEDIIVVPAHLVVGNTGIRHSVRVTNIGTKDLRSSTVPKAVKFFDGTSGNSHCHDIAVLLLKKALKVPLSVHADSSQVDRALDRMVEVVGFGAANFNGSGAGLKRQGTARVTQLNFLPDIAPACKDRAEILIQPMPGGPCIGDSGAPVYLEVEGKFQLIAMVSRFEPPSPDCLGPSACLRLDSYAGWINCAADELRGKYKSGPNKQPAGGNG